MYLNIISEMNKKQLNEKSMAMLMKIKPETFEAKLNQKTKLTIKDVFKMQKIFNQNYCTFEYLLKDL